MTPSQQYRIDPRLDLVLERTIDVPTRLVWEAWTKPEHMKHWFVPKPWTVGRIDIDLRPGGTFLVEMRSPDGKETSDAAGCVLEVVPNERLVWTDALQPGFRPSGEPFFTAIVSMEPSGKGTRYTAIARHKDEATRKKHEEMGFHEGWGTCLDQLVELMRGKK